MLLNARRLVLEGATLGLILLGFGRVSAAPSRGKKGVARRKESPA